ncbi:type 4 pilus major pilin [Alteromonas antoniana]|uniref:type 4 pilus major pilin n=1 Tax=Alteromonas antoniana TaxID=2803813 RepID=UPI001C453E6B|nr:type 4 pilus major pilin [Alteromonas antoniana]
MLFKLRTRKNRGILSLDAAFTIAIIVGMTAYVQAKTEPLASKSDENLISDGITHIIEGARNYKNGATDGYSSIDITTLSSLGLVPDSFANSNGNPVGGAYTVTGTTANTLTVTATGLTEEVCTRIGAKMGRYVSTDTANCTAGTIAVTTN